MQQWYKQVGLPSLRAGRVDFSFMESCHAKLYISLRNTVNTIPI